MTRVVGMLGMAWEDNFVKYQENGWKDLLKSLPWFCAE